MTAAAMCWIAALTNPAVAVLSAAILYAGYWLFGRD